MDLDCHLPAIVTFFFAYTISKVVGADSGCVNMIRGGAIPGIGAIQILAIVIVFFGLKLMNVGKLAFAPGK